MNGKSMRTYLLVIFAVIGTAILSLIVLYGVIILSWQPPTNDVAVYADMSLSGTRNKHYRSLTTGDGGGTAKIARLFVTLGSGRTIFLPDVKPDDVREMAFDTEDIEFNGRIETCFRSSDFYLWFEGERFVSGTIYHGLSSTTRNGKQYSLPISQQDMVEAFGKPLRYEKSVSGAP